MQRALTDADFRKLLDIRTGLRSFLRWSEEQAVKAGITPAQHQLLLAVRGSDSASGPTIGEIADALLLRHHSAVELIDRAEAAGLVHRFQDEDDHRVVRLALTREGDRTLAGLASAHLEELARLGPRMSRLWRGLTER
ncbi:MAG: MarR family transcriptional regulator [Actinobacteria bacterium]|nr:MarR family transcriptional regulator [Actinomycetota bacterium]